MQCPINGVTEGKYERGPDRGREAGRVGVAMDAAGDAMAWCSMALIKQTKFNYLLLRQACR